MTFSVLDKAGSQSVFKRT